MRVEVVRGVAGERRYLIVFLESSHADCTVSVYLEVLLVVVASYDCSDNPITMVLVALLVAHMFVNARDTEDKQHTSPCHKNRWPDSD